MISGACVLCDVSFIRLICVAGCPDETYCGRYSILGLITVKW